MDGMEPVPPLKPEPGTKIYGQKEQNTQACAEGRGGTKSHFTGTYYIGLSAL